VEAYSGDAGGYDRLTLVRRRPVTYTTVPTSYGRPFTGPVGGVFAWGDGVAAVGVQRTTGVVNDYISTASPFTFACWFNMQRDVADTRYWGLWSLGGTNAWSASGSVPSHTGTVQASIVTTSGGAARYDATSAGTYAPFVWYHYAAVWRPGSGLYLYVDGRQDGSNTSATTTMRAVDELQFGGAFGGGSRDLPTLAGAMSDARFYSRALNDAEVWSLYDPQTRWDLYYVPGRRVFVDLAAAPGGATVRAGWQLMTLGVQ
jgi:hypothetical protein